MCPKRSDLCIVGLFTISEYVPEDSLFPCGFLSARFHDLKPALLQGVVELIRPVSTQLQKDKSAATRELAQLSNSVPALKSRVEK